MMHTILVWLCVIAVYLLGVLAAWYMRKMIRKMAVIEGDIDIYLLGSWTYVIPMVMLYFELKREQH